MTDEEMAELLGRPPEKKLELVLVGDRLFRREGVGWYEYEANPTSLGTLKSDT